MPNRDNPVFDISKDAPSISEQASWYEKMPKEGEQLEFEGMPEERKTSFSQRMRRVRIPTPDIRSRLRRSPRQLELQFEQSQESRSSELTPDTQLSFEDIGSDISEKDQVQSIPTPIYESLEQLPEPELSMEERRKQLAGRLFEAQQEQKVRQAEAELKRRETALEKYGSQIERFSPGELIRIFVRERDYVYRLLRQGKGTEAEVYMFRDILNEAKTYGVDAELYDRMVNLRKSIESIRHEAGKAIKSVGRGALQIPRVGASGLKKWGEITGGLSRRQAQAVTPAGTMARPPHPASSMGRTSDMYDMKTASQRALGLYAPTEKDVERKPVRPPATLRDIIGI